MATARKGNKFLLRMANTEDAGANAAAYQAATGHDVVAGLRNVTWTWAKGTIDANTKNNNGWQNVVEGGGNKTVTVTADGVWISNADTITGDTVANGGRLLEFVSLDKNWDCSVIDEDLAFISGRFHCDSFSRTGELNGMDTFSITMTSTGPVYYVST